MSATVAAADYYKKTVGYDSEILLGSERAKGSDGSCCSYEPDENGRPPGPEYDVSGFIMDLEGTQWNPRNWGRQGGLLGMFGILILTYCKAYRHPTVTWFI